MGDFNLALVIVAVVVCVLVLLVSIYLLVNYQHPDDVNQAYFPKLVVVLGLSVAVISILMLPADVANRHACRHAIYNGACNLTLPMKTLWFVVYIADAVLVFFVIPFAMFYYEGDQDKSVAKRLKSALLWVVTSAIVCGLVLGILYALVGKVDFTVRHLSSSAISFPSSWTGLSSNQPCIGPLTHQCAAYAANASSETTWTMRTSFPEYVVALATIVGSVLFSIFGGVGIACLPLGLIFAFIRRPKAVITRSQYIKEATELGKKARELKKAAEALHQEERSGNKGRKWRKNVKAVEKELLLLEDDMKALEEMYPQGEKAETAWALTVLGYLGKLILGVVGVIQFCATAFGYYAQATAAQEIFGHTLQSLRGIKYLYKYNVFQYAFVGLAIITLFYYAAFVRMEKEKTKGQVPAFQLIGYYCCPDFPAIAKQLVYYRVMEDGGDDAIQDQSEEAQPAGHHQNLVEINEAWKVKAVGDSTVLPKGKAQAKFEAVTLPDNDDMEVEQPMHFPDASFSAARFQHMRLDDLDEFYVNIDLRDEEDVSHRHQDGGIMDHQMDEREEQQAKPPEEFRRVIGSHPLDISIEKLRANLENMDFQGGIDEAASSDHFVTPRSPGDPSYVYL
ncbi:putative LIMR family protein [Cocos nucifera]|uniref:Putative LIMR family protein n=1 Tax=Cocos nucifera TaxID=13894 RepID=A0A8K0N0H3_COCNU|nr:putative LIMR family protein [Cocos nucifera]